MRIAPLLCFVLAMTAVARVAAADGPTFERVYAGLDFDRPLYLAPHPADADAVVVVEQAGRISWFPNRAGVTPDELTVALDISGRKVERRGNEEGLLGLAYHPSFADNGFVYLHYSSPDPKRNVLSRWKWVGDGIDPDSEEIILEVEQPYSNHNGGHIDFGPDGYLYVALGDGGAGGDPLNSGQRLDTLLGKILRIDVDRAEGGRAYAIPPDNPFADREDARGEIWAYGLRNVWRFAFDPETDELWAADVGQNAFEEVNVIVKGGNYGWNVREGFAAFRGGPLSRKPEGMIDPILHYPRSVGKSVTGGYVYRGEDVPEMRGYYFYGDHVSGTVWAVRRVEGGEPEIRELGHVPMCSSFGVDAEGELYAVSLRGPIYKLVP